MVSNCHLVRDERVIANRYSAIRGKNSADERAVIANDYFAMHIEVKKSAVVNPCVMTYPNTAIAPATTMQKGKRAVHPTARSNLHILGQGPGEPIMRQ